MFGAADETRYQVFVSSTFNDLKEEREKVLQAILEIRAFPAGMELFPAADDEQFEFIKREIESSDYYLVVIAGRYGSLASDGMSFTEKEYDYAVSIGKPILTFAHKDIGKLIGEKLESTDDGKQSLLRFREKALKGRLANLYESPNDLKARVFHSLVQSFNVKPMRGWVRSGQTSRTDLETINRLQGQVLELESTVSQLREKIALDSPRLAFGDEQVTWSLILTASNTDEDVPSSLRKIEIPSTWDEMLLVVFPGGSSRQPIDELFYALNQWVVSRLSPEQLESLKSVQPNSTFGSKFSAEVNRIRVELHRQFTGLGLMREDVETTYQTRYSSGGFSSHETIPKRVELWRLTEKGEKYIAARYGYQSSRSGI